ncbi:MAG: NAD(P)H-dependent oxidoreductase [Propionibacteriaceae bacterium]|jgi:FMN reductase|nr:NAD(P)H-dependent oxidoreductase [Propionibacteriaceae bacterium]
MKLLLLSGGMSEESTTTRLVRELSRALMKLADERSIELEVSAIQIGDLLDDVSAALAKNLKSEKLKAAERDLASADGLIAGTPVYKAGVAGPFSSFMHVLDPDVLVGTPVLLAATGGSARHALVVDTEMRSLFAFMRALAAPTAVYATGNDWGDPDFSKRLKRAAFELLTLMGSGYREAVRGEGWNAYQHAFGSAAQQEIDFDSEFMRMARGEV